MSKFYYAAITGFIPVVSEEPIKGYPMMTSVNANGQECDHEGNRVHRGYVWAPMELEAYQLVRKAVKLIEAKQCCYCSGFDYEIPGHTCCEDHKERVCSHGQLFLAYCPVCIDLCAPKVVAHRAGRL